MNIFIDANIVYKDPFFQKSYPKKLLEYAEEGIITIYLLDLIQDEIKNNYKKELQIEYSKYFTAVNKLNEFLPKPKKVEKENIEIDNYVKELNDFYNELIFNDSIGVIKYSNELLPKLIERSILKKKPFDTNKTELRDATFWLAICDYIDDNDLDECVLLTKNTKDFFNKDTNDLHEDLRADNNEIEVFKDIKEFFDVYDDILAPDDPDKKLDDLLTSQKFDSNYLTSILNDYFLTELSKESSEYFSNKYPEELDINLIDGYLDAEMGVECLFVNNIDIDKDVFSQTLIINGTAEINGYVDIYSYTSIVDKGEDKFFLRESREVIVYMDFNFSYDLNDNVSDIFISNIEF